MSRLKRLFIQLIALMVFLSLSIGFLFLLANMMPREADGQGIGGGGPLVCLIWLVGILVFSALATVLRRFLLRQAGVEEKQKLKRGGQSGA